MEKSITKKLFSIQQNLHVEKSKGTSAIRYKYRSASDIIEKAKPLLEKEGCILLMSDELESSNGSSYIKASVAIVDTETNEEIRAYGFAREAQTLAGMSPGQITGATSSYARKYALGALFAIDDTKDLDEIADDQASGKLPADNAPADGKIPTVDAFIARLKSVKSSDEFNAVWKSNPSLQKDAKVIEEAKVVCNALKTTKK